ncbi:hypothetical protein [Ammoniphilus resinae]|uniref:mRNA interferase RelE/StbE n=1 Tax=Ammoniphilus resinae TaxID=861532 RepID=A0ABS4GSG9_9BACL|nr:hypothetical protein [Ammoniphilus resinae]MBP1933225.1 mRNA interferase RelE/StbE [Ammoniphilus resinae]
MNPRFDVRLDPDAVTEYNRLDGSVVPIVNKAIDELEYRADEAGKPLGNKHGSKLAGCKEIKLREAGIRIVFRITNEVVEVLRVVYVLTIERRSDDFVFKIASQRLRKMKRSKEELKSHLSKGSKWNDSSDD